MDFPDVPNDAFTVHRFPSLAANPSALCRVITRHISDPVSGQVYWKLCKGEHVQTNCTVFILPLAKIDGSLERNRLLLGRGGNSVGPGRTLHSL